MRSGSLFQWIHERHSIYIKRAEGLAKPWTTDQILQSYRFCNVYRELDTVTVWIKNNWREPYKNDPNLWFAMVIARLVNWPETLTDIGYPINKGQWTPEHFLYVMNKRKAHGQKVFSGAYIVSTNGKQMDKAEYLAEYVLGPLWAARDSVRPKSGDTLEAFHTRLMKFDGMGSFMAAQVVADMKYAPVLLDAEDWWDWAAPGPGSKRGMNRLLERDIDSPFTPAQWREKLAILKPLIDKLVHEADLPPIHAQDLQNCLCEFDKYERTRLGEGKPRSSYPGR